MANNLERRTGSEKQTAYWFNGTQDKPNLAFRNAPWLQTTTQSLWEEKLAGRTTHFWRRLHWLPETYALLHPKRGRQPLPLAHPRILSAVRSNGQQWPMQNRVGVLPSDVIYANRIAKNVRKGCAAILRALSPALRFLEYLAMDSRNSWKSIFKYW